MARGVCILFTGLFFLVQLAHAANSANDPLFTQGKQPHFNTNRIPEAWQLHEGSEDVVVAVIDRGFDYQHPDLNSRLYVNSRETPNNGVDDDNNGVIDDIYGTTVTLRYDSDGSAQIEYTGSINPVSDHGTAVAGIIGAAGDNSIGMTGVMKRVKLMNIRLDSISSDPARNGISTFDAFVEALNYIYIMKRRYSDSDPNNGGANIRVVNFSGVLSGGISGVCVRTFKDPASTTYLEKLVNRLFSIMEGLSQERVLLVSSVDNVKIDMDLEKKYIPANCGFSNLIVVTGMGNPAYGYGAQSVHIAAPSEKILATISANVPGRTVIYDDSRSGASLATPQVAGTAGLMFSLEPSLTAERVKEIIIGTAKPNSNLSGPTVSGGQLDTFAAMLEVAVRPPLLFTNPLNRMDINADDKTTPLDALLIINTLNLGLAGQLPLSRNFKDIFYDVNLDGKVTANDALQLISALNQRAATTVQPASINLMTTANNMLTNGRALAPELDAQLGLVATNYYNLLGLGERWVYGSKTGYYYFISTDNKAYEWRGTFPPEKNPVIGQFAVPVNKNPELLYRAYN